jgi:hypothetical protein
MSECKNCLGAKAEYDSLWKLSKELYRLVSLYELRICYLKYEIKSEPAIKQASLLFDFKGDSK